MRPSTPNRDRLLAHLRECVAVADRVPTPEEIVAAEMLLAERPQSVQRTLFNPAPPTRESCPGDKPRLPAGGADSFGVLEQPCPTASQTR